MLEKLAKCIEYLWVEKTKLLNLINFTLKIKKKMPNEILNESLQNRKWFFIGFYAADGHKKNE